MNKPHLSELGWTVESLRIAQAYGQVLVDDYYEDELVKWEEYISNKNDSTQKK